MARPVTVTVQVLQIDTGLWCIPCALPSAARITVALGRHPSGLGTFARCTDCGSDRVED